ncbi:ABC transporter ATP-binding protein [Alterinioella nitratireducens]|uniref:ABC transporter ATP-binding protein n=1 Tax=Alterinioella nitratireducens TaxID=2735915 RepID=UPI000C4421EE|nr:ABC transporter ATP-binding protein [Alterinioella nitratireducens]MAN15195.1 iron ABC transporter [Dinoroseobacter sp.]MAX72689.1 iron ABC transporter [Nioella sp.]NPD20839.1 ABC transporter ATP-binding protein [Alterinioella nitratireducens]
MPSDPAIEITDLHVTLGGAPRVAGFSLNVAEGQFHGLLGPNGAGKTTVLRSLYRAQRIDAGELRIAGRAIHDWPQSDWAGTVGALVQEGGTFQGLSVRDVIEIGMMGLPLSGPERAARIDAALAQAGLSDRSDTEAARISGGERQRTHIAQLLARGPQVFLLDEPSNHLDLCYQLILLDEIKRRRATVLATFHDLTLAARYCDLVTLMKDGRAHATGRPADVLTRDNIRSVFRVDGWLENGAMRIEAAI